MTDRLDIRIECADLTSEDLADALGEPCAGTTIWSRDGILEQQVSTNEAHQFCFRNEPGTDRPRAGVCLAGPPHTLTVAAVVPIDRGVELSDAQYNAILRDFYGEVVQPALQGTAGEARLVGDD